MKEDMRKFMTSKGWIYTIATICLPILFIGCTTLPKDRPVASSFEGVLGKENNGWNIDVDKNQSPRTITIEHNGKPFLTGSIDNLDKKLLREVIWELYSDHSYDGYLFVDILPGAEIPSDVSAASIRTLAADGRVKLHFAKIGMWDSLDVFLVNGRVSSLALTKKIATLGGSLDFSAINAYLDKLIVKTFRLSDQEHILSQNSSVTDPPMHSYYSDERIFWGTNSKDEFIEKATTDLRNAIDSDTPEMYGTSFNWIFSNIYKKVQVKISQEDMNITVAIEGNV